VRFKCTFLLFCLVLMLITGGSASGQCTALDDNNDADHAQAIALDGTVSDWVCPDDPFDFYVAEIPEGGEASGRIIFSSPQVSTVLRVEHEATGARVVPDWSTNDERLEFTIPIPAGAIPSGRYIIRVSHWSDAAYDHEYTLTLDLTVTGGPECVADGNEEPEDASEIAFDSTVNDWVCDADHIDIWHFAVTNDVQSRGSIRLTADPGELILYLYDSDSDELFQGRTVDGELEYDMGIEDRDLLNGDYYIGVFLPLARDDENSYSLNLRQGLPVVALPSEITMAGMAPGVTSTSSVPWPSNKGNKYNCSLSIYSGPPGVMTNTVTFDSLETSAEDMDNNNELWWGLVIAPGNIGIMSNTDKDVWAIDLVTGEPMWQDEARGLKSPVIGPDGQVFYIGIGTDMLMAMDSTNGYLLWRREIGRGAIIEVENIGRYIYTGLHQVFTGDMPTTYVHAYKIENGDLAFSCGPFYGQISGVAEDTSGNIIIECPSKLYKYNNEGELQWFVELPWDFHLMKYDYYGPVIDRHNRIWVHHDKKTRWRVYDRDGTIYKEGDYGFRPRAICMDTRGRTYIADDDAVTCFDDYDEQVWTSVVCKPYIDDLAIGQDGNIYLTSIGRHDGVDGVEYTAELVTISSDDGRTLNKAPLDIDHDVIDYIQEIKEDNYVTRQYANIAIGELGKVAVLHASGVLEVFTPPFLQLDLAIFEALGGD